MVDGMVTAARRTIRLDSGEYLVLGSWGWTQISRESVADLVTFTGLSEAEVLEHLAGGPDETRLAEEWKRVAPKTQEQMRTFYSGTDAYIWVLPVWTATQNYDSYRGICRRIADRQSPRAGCLRALDYGSGIGETAILLAQLGYEVTIADVPGRTFDFAQHRLRRRGLRFEAIKITEDMPPLGHSYDAIVAFDVLEHVHAPDRVLRHLLEHLAPQGLLSQVSPFDMTEGYNEGAHLAQNKARWGGGRWGLFVSGLGLRTEWGCIHERAGGLSRLVRRVHYVARLA